MAILINGNGNPAIYPDQDADWFASIFGGQTAITGVGSQFAAEIQDANTIALADGVIITKEGRRIQLDANQSDIFEIPTGAQGTTNYYIIGYCLTTNDDSSQTAETFVELMENATDTIEEDTFRDGADKVYVSLYRVTQTGFNLETPELLLPQVGSITQLNADLTELDTNLTANNKEFIFAYSNGSYGYKAGGADTFHPFKSGARYKSYAKGLGSCSIARSSGCVYPFYFEVAGNQQCSAGYVDSNGNITWLTTYAYTSNYHHVTVNSSTIDLSNTQGGYMCYIWKIG